jgi:hypothetical protein
MTTEREKALDAWRKGLKLEANGPRPEKGTPG